ncbi:hypothetical protein M409DRAFT_55936 [Zasmidium cellare ATCC 36951]|uniref:Uncharacterized protein n=1 Tax=Zasmidium cellare ATCC 36951 TaxID=1080233 RepID=A0A6A6CGG3_ZASCE|nr:uncharacterized protein M409DRAFT_55936 [Zasmidium cellare ATCC 36951]KAF2165032.1 hypothetical protein M409DRAFT_55936 [Zasmidium cellare ATCC 36951]
MAHAMNVIELPVCLNCWRWFKLWCSNIAYQSQTCSGRQMFPLSTAIDIFDSTVVSFESALHDELADSFRSEEGSKLTFRFSDEDCTTRRPLQDPRSMSPANRSIQVHIDRQAETTVPWIAKLYFKFEADVEGYVEELWTPSFMAISMTDTLDAVRDRVQKQVNLKLKRQQRLGSKHRLRPKSNPQAAAAGPSTTASQRRAVRVGFRTVVHSFDFGSNNRTVDLDADNPYVKRVRLLIDLFEHPIAFCGKDLEIVVSISVSWLGSAHQEDIVERIRPRPKQFLYARIGDTGDQIGDDAKGEVPMEYALTARLDESKRLLDLRELAVWNFGEFCVGDLTQAEAVPLHRDYQLLPAFKNVKTVAEVGKVLRSSEIAPSRVPLLPSMSLGSSKYPSPARMSTDDGEATIAVRLVNHLPEPSAQNLNLENENCQVWVNNDDAAIVIEQQVAAWLRDHQDEKGNYAFRSVLFDDPLKGNWATELWAMPQNSTSLTLYRFDEEKGFSDFLDQAHVAAGDLKVYMECHIWPKDAETLKGL